MISLTCFVVLGLFYCSLSRTPLSEVLPVKKIGFSKTFYLVMVTVSVSIISSYLADIVVSNFSQAGVENTVSFESNAKSPLEDILYFISMAVIPPISEEFMTRGIILHKLRGFGDSFAIVTSALMFALLHGNIVQIPFTFPVGIVLAFITIKSGSIIPAVISHFVINGLSSVSYLLTSNNIVSEDTAMIIYFTVRLAIIVLGIISAYMLSKNRGYFSVKDESEIPMKSRIVNSLTSVGMIFALLYMITRTLMTLKVDLLWFLK
jgi:membrane protease YdiL (CAAX protease family)